MRLHGNDTWTRGTYDVSQNISGPCAPGQRPQSSGPPRVCAPPAPGPRHRYDGTPLPSMPHPHSQSRVRPIALPPQIQGVTRVILHPALTKSGAPLAIDFALLLRAESNAAWYHLLSTPATHPALPSLTILSPRLPWAITAHASGKLVRYLTVADVMGAIWDALSLHVDSEQFKDWEITTQRGSYSPKRRKGITYRNGMTRLDLLEGKTRFAGLSESTMGCDVWALEVA